MEKPACLMRSFSCNNQIKMVQGNHVHDVGGSVTSIKFMSDSLGSERWSNVSKRCYVEEAKSYTQPGSVAEKKAFFDAFYKKIAAQKAAAAALLEQEKAAAANAHEVTSKVVDLVIDNNIKNLEVFRKERPLLKSNSKADGEFIHHRKDNTSTPRTKNVTMNDYSDKRRLAPKSLKVLMNSGFVKESCRKTQSTKPASSVNFTPKRAVTPMKTPVKAFANGVDKKQPLVTPAHPTVAGSKSTGPKWHNFSTVSQSLTAYKSTLKSPTISSAFMLRTEDRAARRKQKLEEKFNEKQAHVVQQKAQYKEKSKTEFRTLRESSCFKALPLPDFYKGRGTPEKILEAIQNRSRYEKHLRSF